MWLCVVLQMLRRLFVCSEMHRTDARDYALGRLSEEPSCGWMKTKGWRESALRVKRSAAKVLTWLVESRPTARVLQRIYSLYHIALPQEYQAPGMIEHRFYCHAYPPLAAGLPLKDGTTRPAVLCDVVPGYICAFKPPTVLRPRLCLLAGPGKDPLHSFNVEKDIRFGVPTSQTTEMLSRLPAVRVMPTDKTAKEMNGKDNDAEGQHPTGFPPGTDVWNDPECPHGPEPPWRVDGPAPSNPTLARVPTPTQEAKILPLSMDPPALPAASSAASGYGVMTTAEFHRQCKKATPSPVWSSTANNTSAVEKGENEDNQESLHMAEDIEMELPATGQYPEPPAGETMADLATDSDIEEQLGLFLDRQDMQVHEDMMLKKEAADKNRKTYKTCPNCRTPGDAREAHDLIDCPQPECCFVCLSKEHLQKDCPKKLPTDLSGQCSSEIVPWTEKEKEIEAAFIESIRRTAALKRTDSASSEKGPSENQ